MASPICKCSRNCDNAAVTHGAPILLLGAWAIALACGSTKDEPTVVSQEAWLAEHGEGLDLLTTRLDKVAERLAQRPSAKQVKTTKLDPPFLECKADFRHRDCNAKFVARKWLENYQVLGNGSVPFEFSGGSITLAFHILRDARSGKLVNRESLPFNEGISYQARALRYLVVVDEMTRVEPTLISDDSYAGGGVAIDTYVVDLATATVLGEFSAVGENSGDLFALGDSRGAKKTVMQANLNHAAEYVVRRHVLERWPEAVLETEGTDAPFGQL